MSIRFEWVPAEERRRWEEALRDVPHGYWHAWHVCHAVAIASDLPTRLCVAYDRQGVLAVTPVTERESRGERDLFTPVGFSGFAAARTLPADFSSQWSAFAAASGFVAGYFALHPQFGIAEAHSGLASDNELFVLDLAGGPDEVLRRCDRSVRRAVRAAADEGLQFITCRRRLIGFMLENYAGCMATLDARVRWPAATLAAMLEDPELLVVGVEDEAGICAAHSFAIAGQSSELHLHLWVRDGRRHTTALIWWGLQQLSSAGVASVNLGGGVTRDDAVARAKRKFRPRAVPLLRAREIYRPETYRELCLRAGVDPGSTGYHPAYHAPQHEVAAPARSNPGVEG